MKSCYCAFCDIYAIALNYGLDPVICKCGRLMMVVDFDEE